MAWTNADGLQVRFASDWKTNALRTNRPGTVNSFGAVKEIVIDFDLQKLPASGTNFTADLDNDGTNDGFYAGDVKIPAGASVVGGYLVVGEAAAGGTSIALGLYEADGTALDADGLLTAAAGVTANMALGDRVNLNGAYVATTAGTNGIGTVDGYIAFTTDGTFTAGRGKVVIEYIEAAALPTAY